MRRGTRREIKSSRHRIKNALPTLFLSRSPSAEAALDGRTPNMPPAGENLFCIKNQRALQRGARDAVAVQKGQKADNNFLPRQQACSTALLRNFIEKGGKTYFSPRRMLKYFVLSFVSEPFCSPHLVLCTISYMTWWFFTDCRFAKNNANCIWALISSPQLIYLIRYF